MHGRLSPFIELGVGFNPDLTARDNAIINAIMLGLSRRQALERLDEIIAFGGHRGEMRSAHARQHRHRNDAQLCSQAVALNVTRCPPPTGRLITLSVTRSLC